MLALSCTDTSRHTCHPYFSVVFFRARTKAEVLLPLGLPVIIVRRELCGGGKHWKAWAQTSREVDVR